MAKATKPKAFELWDRHKDGLKKAIEELRSEDKKEFGKVNFSNCLDDCVTLSDPHTADRLIRNYLRSLSVSDEEINEWFCDDMEYARPRTLADFAVNVLHALETYSSGDLERVDHQDHGDSETLVYKIGDRTFQVQVSEVEAE